MSYQNPVIPGFYPDPSICRVGDDYYLVNSSFGYFPGVPLWHSKDLVHWRQMGYCLTRESQLRLDHASVSSGGIYAPTLRYHAGRFYMVTTNVTDGGHFYVWSDDPTGRWSDPIYVDQPGIDPSLFFDEDGTVYFTSTGGMQSEGIYQCEIDIETGQKRSDTRLVWTGTGGAFPEGPHLYRIHGYYYLMCAEGGTEYGHMETIARGNTPYGPFESCPWNPILTHRSLNHPIQATGHADLVQSHDGRWWAVFLGIRPVRFPYRHHLGRETFLAPVTWTDDGWPLIGDHGTIELEMQTETLPAVGLEATPEMDPFDEPVLGVQWNFIGNPRDVKLSLEDRKGWLGLSGSNVKLTGGGTGTPAFVGCRQRHFECEVSTSMEFEPQDEDQAGLVVYMNESHHYIFGIAQINGRRVLILQRQVGSLTMQNRSLPIAPSKVELRIQATPEQYVFSFQPGDQPWQVLGEAETYLISTEVAGGFTGAFFGLYSYSPAGTIAYFDWFRYHAAV